MFIRNPAVPDGVTIGVREKGFVIQRSGHGAGQRSDAGFSLVEIMLAIALAGLFLVIIAQGLTYMRSSFFGRIYQMMGIYLLNSSEDKDILRLETYAKPSEELTKFLWSRSSTPSSSSVSQGDQGFIGTISEDSDQMSGVSIEYDQAREGKSCDSFHYVGGTGPGVSQIQNLDLSSVRLGQNNMPVALGVLGQDLVLGLNSSSSTDPDIAVLEPSITTTSVRLISSLDTGPGLADLKVTGFDAFTGETSVKFQAHEVDLHDVTQPVLVRSYVIPGSNSTTTPITKHILLSHDFLIVGTQKTSLNEIDVFDVFTGQLLAYANTDFGINKMYVRDTSLVVLSPLDPEVEVFDLSPLLTYKGYRVFAAQVEVQGRSVSTAVPVVTPTIPINLKMFASYDAPGGSGNGRSFDTFGNLSWFGRSLGGNELMLLEASTSTSTMPGSSQAQATDQFSSLAPVAQFKENASVDMIIADKDQSLVFTSDQNRELQVFKLRTAGNLQKMADIDLPTRVADAVCLDNMLYVALKSTSTPLVRITSGI